VVCAYLPLNELPERPNPRPAYTGLLQDHAQNNISSVPIPCGSCIAGPVLALGIVGGTSDEKAWFLQILVARVKAAVLKEERRCRSWNSRFRSSRERFVRYDDRILSARYR